MSDLTPVVQHEHEHERPRHRRHRRPTYTLTEALRSGLCDKETYLRVDPLWKATAEYHDRLGTPMAQCEPPTTLTNKLATSYLEQAEADAEQIAATGIDSRCDIIEASIETISSATQELLTRSEKLTTKETKQTLGIGDAVDRVTQNQDIIRDDFSHGLRHHSRTSTWLKIAGHIAPWVEGIGLLSALTYLTNIDWAKPFEDLTGFVYVLILLVVLAGQSLAANQVGTALNHRRQAIAEHDAAATEDATNKLKWSIPLLVLTASGVVGGLLYRAWTVGEANSAGIGLPLLIVLSIIAGIVLPTLTVAAKALDGSTLSRESDELVPQLDADLAIEQNLRQQVTTASTMIDTLNNEIREDVVPTILRNVLDHMERARAAYAWLRVQIGGLPNHDQHNVNLPSQVPNSTLIQVPIPGAPPTEVRAITGRDARVKSLQNRHQAASTAYKEVPAHPWHDAK